MIMYFDIVDFGRLEFVHNLPSFKLRLFLFLSPHPLKSVVFLKDFERDTAQTQDYGCIFPRGIVTFLGAGWSH